MEDKIQCKKLFVLEGRIKIFPLERPREAHPSAFHTLYRKQW
jgi:hypothetical protein